MAITQDRMIAVLRAARAALDYADAIEGIARATLAQRTEGDDPWEILKYLEGSLFMLERPRGQEGIIAKEEGHFATNAKRNKAAAARAELRRRGEVSPYTPQRDWPKRDPAKNNLRYQPAPTHQQDPTEAPAPGGAEPTYVPPTKALERAKAILEGPQGPQVDDTEDTKRWAAIDPDNMFAAPSAPAEK